MLAAIRGFRVSIRFCTIQPLHFVYGIYRGHRAGQLKILSSGHLWEKQHRNKVGFCIGTKYFFPGNVLRKFVNQNRQERQLHPFKQEKEWRMWPGASVTLVICHAHTHFKFELSIEYSQVTTDRWNVARSWFESNLHANCPTSSSVMLIISKEQSLIRYIRPYSLTYCGTTSSSVTRKIVLLDLPANSHLILSQLPYSCPQGKVTLSPFLKTTDSESATVRIKGENKVETLLDCVDLRMLENQTKIISEEVCHFFFKSYLQCRERVWLTLSQTSSLSTGFQMFFCLVFVPSCCRRPSLCQLWSPS